MPRSTFYSSTTYTNTIKLISGDTLPELDIILRDSSVAADANTTIDEQDPTTWATLSLADVDKVEMKFRKEGASTFVAIPCSIVTPFSEGHVIMRWREDDLVGLSGVYEGEIEVTYNNDDPATPIPVVTVYDILKFDVRAGF